MTTTSSSTTTQISLQVVVSLALGGVSLDDKVFSLYEAKAAQLLEKPAARPTLACDHVGHLIG
jgi:hypothetical protein